MLQIHDIVNLVPTTDNQVVTTRNFHVGMYIRSTYLHLMIHNDHLPGGSPEGMRLNDDDVAT